MTPTDPLTALSRSELLQALSSCRPQMALFTERLVRVPTENPPGRHYRDCVDVIAAEVSALGLEPQIVEIPAPDDHGERRYALLASLGAGDRTLYFHGHYDVVPASVERNSPSAQAASHSTWFPLPTPALIDQHACRRRWVQVTPESVET